MSIYLVFLMLIALFWILFYPENLRSPASRNFSIFFGDFPTGRRNPAVHHLILQPAHQPSNQQADACPADDIEGVMNAEVNPGVSHRGCHPIKKRRKSFERLGKKESSGKDVYSMGRRERIRRSEERRVGKECRS